MSATIETTNRVLAAYVQAANVGSTLTESAGVYTVTHTDRLVVSIAAYQQAGGSASYDWLACGDLPAWKDVADLITAGFVGRHTHIELVVVSEEPSDGAKEYISTLQPLPSESWRARRERLARYGIVS